MPRFSFDAISTRWEIDTPADLGAALRRRILARVERFDALYSRFRPDSLVARMAASPTGGRFAFPAEDAPLFELYDRLHAATDGAVDPLVGRVLELLGYDRTYSFRPDAAGLAQWANGRPNWARDVRRDGTVLATSRPLVVDVGAAGKGYLVDAVSALLLADGVRDFLVDGSGDLRHAGAAAAAARIGLEDPFDPDRVIGVTPLRDGALCASAVNRRAWGDGLHHVVDARTGTPVRDVIATWVTAETAALADGLATALFFVAPERLAGFFQFAYVRLFLDGRAEASPNFEGDLFTSEETS